MDKMKYIEMDVRSSSDSEVLERVSDFLPGLFGVIHGHMLTLLGALDGVASDILARIHYGVVRNHEGFLGAIGGLFPHCLSTPPAHLPPPPRCSGLFCSHPNARTSRPSS